MYLSGVVIPDEYDDEENVVVASANFEQIYYPQQYGDDGILDGAEGFGRLQAQALKAKLTTGRAGRRRLRVGRRPLAMVGASPLYDGFGLAPLAVAGAAGGLLKKGVFKKPSPRVFGSKGPLVGTVEGFKQRVESGDTLVIATMDSARKARNPSAGPWQRIWTEMLPTWRYNAQVYAAIKRADPAFRGASPTGVTAVVPTGSGTPTQAPSPVYGPTTDATGAPAPYFPPVPSPIPAAGGGAPTASEVVAAEATGEPVAEAAGFSLDPKLLLIGGAVVLFLMSGKRGRRR